MNILYKLVDKIIQIGHFLLLLIGIDVIFTSVLLLCNISVSPTHFIISYCLSIICYIRVYKKEIISKLIIGIIISTIVIVLAVATNALIQEIAFDGNLYHKFATGILKMGWNPVYDNIYDYIDALKIPAERISKTDIWVACYPKAAWYFEATVYALTDSIESAKIFNFLTFIATVGVTCDYFNSKVKPIYALFLGLIFAGIPVSFAQLFTYYVDGALGQLLVASVIILMSLSDDQYGEGYKKYQMFYLGICIVLCCNLKFTGLILEAVFCGVFFLYWCLKKRMVLIKVVTYYLLVVSIAVFIVGAGTYITNIKDFGNPLYPIIGSNEIDPNNSLKSVGLDNASPFRQLLTMLFVRVSTDDSKSVLEWKIPFTFKVEEFAKCCHDNIRGGGGVFFSGILCISIIMFPILFLKLYKVKKKELISVVIVIGCSLFLMIIMPAGGQARYSPYIYFIPYLTLFLLILCVQEGLFQKKSILLIENLMICIISVNAFAYSEYVVRGIIESYDYAIQYDQIKASGGVKIDTVLPGIVFNFIDKEIEYEYKLENIVPDGEMKYLKMEYEIVNSDKKGNDEQAN